MNNKSLKNIIFPYAVALWWGMIFFAGFFLDAVSVTAWHVIVLELYFVGLVFLAF